jgi:hypothetical protein
MGFVTRVIEEQYSELKGIGGEMIMFVRTAYQSHGNEQ